LHPVFRVLFTILPAIAFLTACRSEDPAAVQILVNEKGNTSASETSQPDWNTVSPWIGVHVPLNRPTDVKVLIDELPALADLKVNLLITELDYNFEFVTHPELRSGQAIAASDIRKLVKACRARRIRLVPQFQCLGHQSWGKHTHPLLAVYPQFDETPGRYPGNKGIYARSWCPLHPDVNKIVFALLDEILDAFEADALHVGLDEAFIMASDACPRCRGKNPAAVFARAVNDLYDHVVKEKGKDMFMWADRLLDASVFRYGRFEAAANGTQGAVDLLPRDIILCDWHYEPRKTYPSLPYFLDKGFRVLPTSYKNLTAVKALMNYSFERKNKRMMGHLASTWTAPRPGFARDLPQIGMAARRITELYQQVTPTLPPNAAE
jgi:hypothetical protein